MKKLSWSGLKSDLFRRDRSASNNRRQESVVCAPVVSTVTDPGAPTVSASYMSLNQWNAKLACMNGTRSIGDFRSESALNLRERLSFSGFLNLKCMPSFPFARHRAGENIAESPAVKQSKPGLFNSLKRKLKGNLKSPSEYRFKTGTKRQSYCQINADENPAQKEWRYFSSGSSQQSSSNQYCAQSDMQENGIREDPLSAAAEEPEPLREAGAVSLVQKENNGNLAWELFKLEKYGWYWGRMTRGEAERKLADQPDGAFLVRDSSDDCHLLSLSFRCYGRTLHTRIEHSNGTFSFYAYPEADHHSSVSQLIEYLMNSSRSGVFCYSRSRSPGSVSYPVQLTKPVSRFSEVLPLQFMCRFVIRQYVRMDHVEALPLPESLKSFVVRGNSQASPQIESS